MLQKVWKKRETNGKANQLHEKDMSAVKYTHSFSFFLPAAHILRIQFGKPYILLTNFMLHQFTEAGTTHLFCWFLVLFFFPLFLWNDLPVPRIQSNRKPLQDFWTGRRQETSKSAGLGHPMTSAQEVGQKLCHSGEKNMLTKSFHISLDSGHLEEEWNNNGVVKETSATATP